VISEFDRHTHLERGRKKSPENPGEDRAHLLVVKNLNTVMDKAQKRSAILVFCGVICTLIPTFTIIIEAGKIDYVPLIASTVSIVVAMALSYFAGRWRSSGWPTSAGLKLRSGQVFKILAVADTALPCAIIKFENKCFAVWFEHKNNVMKLRPDYYYYIETEGDGYVLKQLIERKQDVKEEIPA